MKRVVVTAGGGGIGRAVAQAFLASGARVHICDISEDAIASSVAASPNLLGAVADVGNPQSVEAYFELALQDLGGVDVLVNNAGIAGPRATVEEISYTEWNTTIQINMNGMFYCIKQVVPAMKAQRSGSIINISTSSTRTGLPHRLPYVVAKAGVEGMTRNLARELGPENIRCNAILPGAVEGERSKRVVNKIAEQEGRSVAEIRESMLKYISMRTMVQPKEIADVAVFLASDAARHVSGQLIGVCGNLEWEE